MIKNCLRLQRPLLTIKWNYVRLIRYWLWSLLDSWSSRLPPSSWAQFLPFRWESLTLKLSTLWIFQVTDPETNETNEHRDFAIAEAIFISWFTIEYLVRGIASPKKWEFLREGMNVIDLLGIVPYFVSLALSNMKSSGEYQDEMRRMAQVFRIMRILRIFRLGRHITGLQTLGATLKVIIVKPINNHDFGAINRHDCDADVDANQWS